MAPCKKVLMLTTRPPCRSTLAAFGVAVDCVAPGKKPPGDACLTAVHEFLGHDLYTELPGHRFAVTADFAAAAAADASRYDALVVPGGRFVERLSVDPLAVSLVAAFAGETATRRRPVVVTCHSQLLLAAAGAMRGVRCTAFFSMRRVVELAGGRWVEPDPLGLCVADGNVLSAIGWPAHGEIIRELLRAMGARVAGGRGQAVLFLCADYVDDYEANVLFRALAGVGCRVEAACPTKRKGEACVTAIYDATPAAASDASSPGRGSIDQGHLLLAAAGLLDGRSCASGVATRVVAGLAGAASVRHGGAVADGKLVTAASWPDLAEFIAHIISLLGITISF
uniref:DJ-1/PfpI domain-containing protein n=1 Tax=Oryza barthii TaxID=65489 RepID=A0A0D3HNJ7_9ORYZ